MSAAIPLAGEYSIPVALGDTTVHLEFDTCPVELLGLVIGGEWVDVGLFNGNVISRLERAAQAHMQALNDADKADHAASLLEAA